MMCDIMMHNVLYPTHDSKGQEIQGFDPSRLLSLRGEIPPDEGKPSNISTRGLLLHEFLLRGTAADQVDESH